MFSEILGVFRTIFSAGAYLTPIFAAFGVVIPPAAIAAVPLATILMDKAEEAMGDGQGALKKAAVTEGLTAFSSKMAELSTGGQKETWAALTPEVISATIDGLAGAANAIAKATQVAPISDDSRFEIMKQGG